MSIKIYLARAMSGRIKEDVVKEAREDKEFFEKAGLEVLCPVIKEEVVATKEKLVSSKKAMLSFWPADKRMIRDAHIVLDMTPHLNSEGTKHEIGYARYFLYRPVIRVFPEGKLPFQSSVAFFEDDIVVDSREEALEYIYRVHGNLYKRLRWRVQLYNRCLLNMIYCWFISWK